MKSFEGGQRRYWMIMKMVARSSGMKSLKPRYSFQPTQSTRQEYQERCGANKRRFKQKHWPSLQGCSIKNKGTPKGNNPGPRSLRRRERSSTHPMHQGSQEQNGHGEPSPPNQQNPPPKNSTERPLTGAHCIKHGVPIMATSAISTWKETKRGLPSMPT